MPDCQWCLGNWTWDGVLPELCFLEGPSQHYQSAVLEFWSGKVAAGLCKRQDFRGGPLLDIHASQPLLVSPQIRERDKGLLRGIFAGRYPRWNRTTSFCAGVDDDGHGRISLPSMSALARMAALFVW